MESSVTPKVAVAVNNPTNHPQTPSPVFFDGFHNPSIEELVEHFRPHPPGYRFCPTDKELVECYLKRKISNQPVPVSWIVSANVYRHKPEFLSEVFKDYGETEWYFFTPRDRKYPNGTRPSRSTDGGYWKATGADKSIESHGERIGFKKSLVFYRGKPPRGVKTNWIMHEFTVKDPPRNKRDANDMRLDDWVLCRVKNKIDKSPRTHTGVDVDNESSDIVNDTENDTLWNLENAIVDPEPMVDAGELHQWPLPNIEFNHAGSSSSFNSNLHTQY
ncbi:hypothetical protein I3760_05G192000 [Carya illinoinensis]|nr:hypothetical protein I3760_05G192000 [Carya illinoinensis]